MKNISPILNFLVASLAVLLSSCTFHSTKNISFPAVNVPERMMNTVIRIEELPQFGNSDKNNSIIALHVKNLSPNTIVFPTDGGISMYTKVGENWISVINNMHYPSEIGYLPPFNEFPPGMATGVSPNIPDLSMPQTIRIVIIGYYENSEEDLVGAYLDIKLLP